MKGKAAAALSFREQAWQLPDDHLAHPHTCGDTRACFRVPTEDPADGTPVLA